MAAHAVRGASGAYRWMRCLGSINLVERLTARKLIEPGQTSVYAEEGSAAHALGEHAIAYGKPARHYLGRGIERVGGFWRVGDTQDGGAPFTVTEEMADAVQVYLDAIAAERERLPCADVRTEVRVYPLADAEEEMYGTADVILWDLVDCVLTVMDYKHGAGVVVEADHNAQTMFYGLGALRAIAGDDAAEAVRLVRLVIVQPRARHVDGAVRVFEMSARDLIEWGGVLRSAAEASRAPDAPLAAGDWCKFCPAAALCPELRRQLVETAKADFDAPEAAVERMLPDPDDERELGRALRLVPLIDMWAREVEAMALRRWEYGRPVDGFKGVRKRTTRRWTDAAAVEAELCEQGLEAEIFERKLRSPAQLEKVKAIGKNWVAEHCEKPEGGVTLVPDTDPRPAVPAPVLEMLATPEIPAEVTSPEERATLNSWLESL